MSFRPLRLVGSAFSAVVLATCAHASFLANDQFLEPAILGFGQAPMEAGQQRRVDPFDPGEISGIFGWSHGVVVDNGLVWPNPGGQQLFINNWDRRVQQQTEIPLQAGQTWKLQAYFGFVLDFPTQERCAVMELWAGDIDPFDPEQLAPGSVLLDSYTLASTSWPGPADKKVGSNDFDLGNVTYTVPPGSPHIGKNLVVSLYTVGGSGGPSRWSFVGLELLGSASSGRDVNTAFGNGGLKISGLDPTQPGTSLWNLPAPWEQSTGSVRVGRVFPRTWVKLPGYATNDGEGLVTEGSLKWEAFIRTWDGNPAPIAAIVTDNGTYYATANSFILGGWNQFAIPFKSHLFRKNHYLTGPIVSQSRFAYDLQTTRSIHLLTDFGGPVSDTNIRAIKVSNEGASAGLTVNCSVIPDGYIGAFGTGIGSREARLVLYDGGVQAGIGTLSGGGVYGSPKVNGYPAGTFQVYSEGDRFLRTYLGEFTFPSDPNVTLPIPIQLRNGDVDSDGVVSIFDYIALSDAFDASNGDPHWDARADLDGDDVVSVFDYIILSDRFDQSSDE